MFGKIFDMDNGFWRAMNRVADIIILNILFLICSIPIITIGASATALYTMTLKIVRDEDTYIAKGFWNAFKSNFKQSTILWLIMLVLGVFLGADLYITSNIDSSFMNALKYVFYCIFFLYAITLSYVFPLQSRFENTVANTLKNSLFIGVAHFLPWSLLILVLNALPIIIFLHFTSAFFSFGIPVFLLFGFATIAFFNSKMLHRVFKKYIPKENEETSDDEDEELSETAADILESQNIIQRLNEMDPSDHK